MIGVRRIDEDQIVSQICLFKEFQRVYKMNLAVFLFQTFQIVLYGLMAIWVFFDEIAKRGGIRQEFDAYRS